MSRDRQRLLQAISETGTVVSELGAQEGDEVRAKLAVKFAAGSWSRFLWERLRSFTSVADLDAWRWIGEYVGNHRAWLLFDPQTDPTLYEFQSGDQLIDVIEEAYVFEYYVTDPDMNYLLCYSHEDVLYAAGTARGWLRARLQDTGLPGLDKDDGITQLP